MKMKSISWAAKRSLVLGATTLFVSFGIGFFVIEWKLHRRNPDQEMAIQIRPPSPPRPPLPPQNVSISCKESPNDPKGKKRPTMPVVVDYICIPEGNLFVSLEPTLAELAAHVEDPKVSFSVTEKGEIVDAEIVRSSGSKALDVRALQQVLNLKFSSSHCRCRIVENIHLALQ